MPVYQVDLERYVPLYLTLYVRAKNADLAEEIANDYADDEDFNFWDEGTQVKNTCLIQPVDEKEALIAAKERDWDAGILE